MLGCDPVVAAQFNHGRQAEELVAEGLFLDLTDLDEKEGWRDLLHPSSLLDACKLDGRLYYLPLNIHSSHWIWLNNGPFATAGDDVQSNWGEFVASTGTLRSAGIAPMVTGSQAWQSSASFAGAV